MLQGQEEGYWGQYAAHLYIHTYMHLTELLVLSYKGTRGLYVFVPLQGAFP